MSVERAAEEWRLVGLRVRMYGTIRDSGFVPIFPRTALVGRQQSGKTTLLRALAGFDPREVEPYSLERDWPRLGGVRKSREQAVCVLSFELGEDGRARLRELGALAPGETPQASSESALETRTSSSPTARPPSGASIATGTSASPASHTDPVGLGARLSLDANDSTNAGHPLAPPPSAPIGLRVARLYDGSYRIEPFEGQAGEHRTAFDGSGARPNDATERWLRARLPVIVHLDPEQLLPEGITSERLLEPSRPDREVGVEALARLLARVGLDADRLRAGLGARDVREASDALREHLAQLGFEAAFELALDRGRLEVFAREGGRRVPFARAPKASRYRTTLELRTAAALDDPPRRPLLLLDGPGRLFRRAERPRMHELFDQCVSAGATVLYTARLPFDVSLLHAEQLLVLSGVAEGATVAWRARDAGTELAVRKALGLNGRPSFRVDERNLIVEGPTDAHLLRALAALCERSGEQHPPRELNWIAAGGSHEVAEVAGFLGRQGLGVIALLDADRAGRSACRALHDLVRRERAMRYVEPLTLAEAAGLDAVEATVEDLFPEDWYLEVTRELVDETGRRAIDDALAARERAARERERALREGQEPAPPENLVTHLAKAFEARGERFPKTRIAEELEERIARATHLDDLPGDMAPGVRRLMRTLNEAATRCCPEGAARGSEAPDRAWPE